MNLISVASAFPPHFFSQSECLESMRSADFWEGLNARSRLLLTKVLEGDSGITKRHFMLDQLSEAWTRDAQAMNEAYEKAAPEMAADAVLKALAKSGHSISDVDVLFVCSCTGYLCPGVSGHVAEKLGMRDDVFLQDMTGLGCGAAVPLMRAASGVIAENPDAVVLTVAVEACSAAFYVEDDFGVLISTCLFGDGAAAALWSGSGGCWSVGDFQSLHVPEHREKIRFTNAGGKLRNQLHRKVPIHVADAVSQLYAKRAADPQAWITHGGGRDVIERLEKVLPSGELTHVRDVMRDYGNLSSPSVLVALEKFLDSSDGEEKRIWMCAFGAGFSAHSCELVRN